MRCHHSFAEQHGPSVDRALHPRKAAENVTPLQSIGPIQSLVKRYAEMGRGTVTSGCGAWAPYLYLRRTQIVALLTSALVVVRVETLKGSEVMNE